MHPDQFEREVLQRKSSRPQTRSRSRGGNGVQLLAVIAVGIVPIVVCSQAPTFTVEKLQLVLSIFGSIMAILEAWKSNHFLFAVLAVSLTVATYFQPLIALGVLLICAFDFTQNSPSVGSVSLLWFSLAIFGGKIL